MTGCCCYFFSLFTYSIRLRVCCLVWFLCACVYLCDCMRSRALLLIVTKMLRAFTFIFSCYIVHSVIHFDRFHPKFDSLLFPYGFPSVSSRNVHMILMQRRFLYLCMCVLAFLMQKTTNSISNWVESRTLPKTILLCGNYIILISMCDGTNWWIKNIPFVLSNDTRCGAYRLKYVVLSSIDDWRVLVTCIRTQK